VLWRAERCRGFFSLCL